MKWIDLPPVWLFAFLVLTWLSERALPWGPTPVIGLLVFALGLGIAAAAILEFARARTTVIPRQAPSALITSGIFRFSRNPIYLADVLILVGLSLNWGKVLGLVLAPVFVVIVTRRFIQGEEARLKQAFGGEYEAYLARTRRWL
ncbi:MAG: isoprenylcysteine carboxylmethyltransferase family protein [Pseudomonadota bacterium]